MSGDGAVRVRARVQGHSMAELTTNHKGAIAEAAIALEATKLGFEVLRPLQEGRRYDLVLDTGPRLWRVQCKWGNLRDGVVAVRTGTSRHSPTQGYVVTTYSPEEIDAIGIYCAGYDECLLVPIEEVSGMTHLHLRVDPTRNGQRCGVRMAAQYRLGAVAQMARATGWQPVGREFESLQLHSETPTSEIVESLLRADDLRTGLGSYIQRTAAGESFTITRRGHVVARLIPPSADAR